MALRLPPPIVPGMTLGLIAPASPVFEPERRDAAVQLLRDMGFRVVRGESVDAVDYCFSGTDKVRAADFQRMMTDDAIDGVVCLRGGYGCARLIPLIDWAEVAKHPKAFVGFSDITALHAALWTKCNLVTYHGPMPGVMENLGLRNEADRHMWLDTLAGTASREIRNPDGAPLHGFGTATVSGQLIGGNLTVLHALIGTDCEPKWDGALLLLEDVAERTDHLDSMLGHLAALGVFQRIVGLIMGDFSRYEGMTSSRKLPISRMVQERCRANLPGLYGLHAGHGRDRITLPMNLRYSLNPRLGTLTIDEGWTQP